MPALDLREIDSLELITRNTGSPELILFLRKGKKPYKSYTIPVSEWYKTPHGDTVRMRVTFNSKKGFWKKFEGKVSPITLNITLFQFKLT
jgi:hypothetical protein